jgi:putative endonuclease
MWYVYIIQCSDNSLYTGTTTDISRRVNEHNRSKGGNYTRIRQPVKLMYQETHSNRSDALKREIQIKRWSKEKKLALINGDKSLLRNLSKSHD